MEQNFVEIAKRRMNDELDSISFQTSEPNYPNPPSENNENQQMTI